MDYVKRSFFCLLLLTLAVKVAQADEFLRPEEAFRYTVSTDGTAVEVHWTVAPGYYAYKSRMKVESATPGVTLDPPVFPKGEIHKDDYFGEQEVFRGPITVTAPLKRGGTAPRELSLKLIIQGCADAGLCYPPQTWDAKVALPQVGSAAGGGIDAILGNARGSNEGDFLPPDDAFRFTA